MGRCEWRPIVSLGPSEHVPVVDEYGLKFTFRIANEERLSIVTVLGTRIDHPSQPEGPAIGYPAEIAPRENLD